jgi:PST family polysaccharide transporter
MSRNFDYLIIGRILGSQSLGYYSLAYRIMLYPVQNISYIVSRVMFPFFSKIQNDNAQFRYSYIKLSAIIGLICFPLMIGLYGLADSFILTLFGYEWKPVIRLIQILIPVGIIQSLVTFLGVIYTSKGRTDWFLRWGISVGILNIISFLIGVNWGIIGVAVSYLVISLLIFIPAFMIPFKLIDLSMLRFLKSLWRSFVCSLIMLIVIMTVKFFLQGLSSALILGILIPVGATVYLLSSWFINRQQILELKNLIYNQQKISP